MTGTINLSGTELALVRDLLSVHLPPDTGAWVFGSRATGTARPYSDLDLALAWQQPLSPDILGALHEALSESDLPFKVDLVDLGCTDAAFRMLIERDMIALPF